MSVSLQSFSNLLGKVNDGHIVLQGDGDAATLTRVNRGQSWFTKHVFYKQMDLTDAADMNRSTRLALFDALTGGEGGSAATYVRFVRQQLGLDNVAESGKPLSARLVKDLISSRDADRAATAQDDAIRAQYDDDGFTIVNNGPGDLLGANAVPRKPDDGLADLKNGLQGPAKEMEDPDKVGNADVPGDDGTAKRIAELKQKIADLRKTAKENLMKQGAELIGQIKTKLASGELVLPSLDEEAPAETKEVDEWTRFLLDLSLEKNGKDYFEDTIEDMLKFDGDNFTAMDHLRYEGEDEGAEKSENHDPDEIRLLEREIDHLEMAQDFEVVKDVIVRRLKDMCAAIEEAFAASKDGFVGADGIGKLMNEKELPSDNNLRSNVAHTFANIETKLHVETRVAEMGAKLKELADKEPTGEDPSLAADLKKLFDEKKQAVLDIVKGSVTGTYLNRSDALAALQTLSDEMKAELDERCAAARKRYEARGELLKKEGFLGHATAKIAECGKTLGAETIKKLERFYTHPEGEVKKLFDAAIDKMLSGTADPQASELRAKSQKAFDAFFKNVLDKEIADGLAELNGRKAFFQDMAAGFFTAGGKEQMAGLEKISIRQMSQKEGPNGGPMTNLWNQIKEKAFAYGFEALKRLQPTKADLLDANRNVKIKQAFYNAVTDFVYRTHFRMQSFDETLQDQAFRNQAHGLGMKHFSARVYLNDKEKAHVAKSIESLRADYCLGGGADETIDLKTGVPVEVTRARLLELLPGALVA